MKRINEPDLEAAAHALITVRETNLGTFVTLPVIYPDGNCVSVSVTVERGDYVVHDAGAGAMILTAAGGRLTKQLVSRLTDLAANYGCDFIENRVTRRCTADQVALAIAMVANASRTVGDKSLAIRRRHERVFPRMVSDRLHELMHERVRDNEAVKGKSGKTYKVTNVILDRRLVRPAAYVKAIANDSSVLRIVGELFDIRLAHEKVRRLAIYDDTQVADPSNVVLLAKVSEVIPFSKGNVELTRALDAAA